MRRTVNVLIPIFSLLLIFACASGKKQPAQPVDGQAAQQPAPVTQEGGAKNFLGSYYDKMQPGPEGGAQKRWVKPGVDFSRYNKLMVETVVFYLAQDSDYKGIEPNEMKELSDKFNSTLVNTLKEKYPVVTQPGPDVAVIRFAITDLEQSSPVLSGVTSVVPIGLGISAIKRGTKGSWTGSGATGGALMVLDSTTNDVIAVAEDRRTASFGERFSAWGSAEEAFKFWAERLRAFLDETHGVKK